MYINAHANKYAKLHLHQQAAKHDWQLFVSLLGNHNDNRATTNGSEGLF